MIRWMRIIKTGFRINVRNDYNCRFENQRKIQQDQWVYEATPSLSHAFFPLLFFIMSDNAYMTRTAGAMIVVEGKRRCTVSMQSSWTAIYDTIESLYECMKTTDGAPGPGHSIPHAWKWSVRSWLPHCVPEAILPVPSCLWRRHESSPYQFPPPGTL